MARKCTISGVSNQFGHRVSHAKNKKKHVFKANLQTKRFFIASENRYIKLRVTTRIIRTIDKLGLQGTLKRYGLKIADITA